LDWFIWFILFVWFVSLDRIHQKFIENQNIVALLQLGTWSMGRFLIDNETAFDISANEQFSTNAETNLLMKFETQRPCKNV
jgi:hypothetical protein